MTVPLASILRTSCSTEIVDGRNADADHVGRQPVDAAFVQASLLGSRRRPWARALRGLPPTAVVMMTAGSNTDARHRCPGFRTTKLRRSQNETGARSGRFALGAIAKNFRKIMEMALRPRAGTVLEGVFPGSAAVCGSADRPVRRPASDPGADDPANKKNAGLRSGSHGGKACRTSSTANRRRSW